MRYLSTLAKLMGILLAFLILMPYAGTAVLALTGLAPRSRFWQYYASSLRLAALITLGCGILTSLYESMRAQLETKERDEQQARQMAVAARLSSLESRIHPHFLFNTLNSISALIREDPVVAERTVERLAALLSFSLDSESDHLVPLRQEMKIVIDYLEIEKTRFGARLRYTMDIPPELQDVEVPPMSLQTLAENSVKHAVSTRREGAEIRINARRDGDRVVLEVQDNGPGFNVTAMTAGHGLDLLKGRLAALFANRAALEIASRSGETAVRLCLPERA